jgi:hypothetical protein
MPGRMLKNWIVNVHSLRVKKLLTTIGYHDPIAWQDTMQLASKLIHVDGYFLQYYAIEYSMPTLVIRPS